MVVWGWPWQIIFGVGVGTGLAEHVWWLCGGGLGKAFLVLECGGAWQVIFGVGVGDELGKTFLVLE